MKIRKARLATEKAIADPWAESRASQANLAARSKDFMAAIRLVQNHAMELVKGADQRVRVEDYLAVLAAAAGEAALVDSGCIDIERSGLVPGQGIFGDAINRILSGDRATVGDSGPTSVVGIMRDHLVPALVPDEIFGSIERVYKHVAEHVGASPWGCVAVSVPETHWPRIVPIKAAFDMRRVVNDEAERLGFQDGSEADGRSVVWSRHGLCAAALASAISQTAATLDPQVAIALSLEMTFGMAKMVPMSRVEFDRTHQETL